MLIVIGFGGAAVTLLVIALLAIFKVDGFHGDRPRDHYAPTVAPAPAPMPQRAAQGPLRVVAQRVDQVEAA